MNNKMSKSTRPADGIKGFNLIDCLTDERDKYRIIWICNIGAEKFWNDISCGIIDEKEDMIVNHIEEINLLLCRKQDIIILRKRPQKDFLDKLEEMGFSIPTILIPQIIDSKLSISQLVLEDKELQKILRDTAQNDNSVYFIPYAVTYLEEQIAENCNLKLIGASSDVNKRLNDKIVNRQIAETLGFNVCKGKLCCSADEIQQAYRDLMCSENDFEKVVVKEPHGASSKGLYIVSDESKLKVYFRRSLKAKLDDNKKWLVEGWYKKKHDLNFQIYVSEEGEVEVFSIKEQVLSDTVYLGSRFPSTISDDKVELFKEYGVKTGKYIFDMGFWGVAGVDAIITQDDTIIPIVEINGRFTLSTYLSYFQYTLGISKYLSRYIKLLTKAPISYRELSNILDRKGLLINSKSKAGVFVYNSGTLPSNDIKSQDLYLGRLFVVIAGKDWNEIEEYNRRLEICINSFNELKAI
ncbi:MAG: ATP-grasp domain-containing protein [Lutisporaceae bacterium]